MFKYIIPSYPKPEAATGDWVEADLASLSSLAEVAREDARSERREEVPMVPGVPMKHQRAISRLMSGASTVRGLMLIHEVGTGKTCTAIQSIERDLGNAVFGMHRGLVLVPNSAIERNFKNELVSACTTRYSTNPNVRALRGGGDFEMLGDAQRVKPRVSPWKYYAFDTFERFAKKIESMSDDVLNQKYNSTFVVIDEVHQLSAEGGKKYKEIDRFLRAVKNKKVLLLTGTPARDNVRDFASVFNLLLDEPMKLDVANFEQKYIVDGKPTPELVSRIAGRVSFLSADSLDVDVKDAGERLDGVAAPLYTVRMSDFQTEAYNRAYQSETPEDMPESAADGGEVEQAKNGGVAYLGARQAARFVFPDGTYGRTAFNNPAFFEAHSGFPRFTKSLKDVLTKLPDGRTAGTAEELRDAISRYSSRYAVMAYNIATAAKRREKSFVYDNMVTGSGLIVFANILELFGFRHGARAPAFMGFELLTGNRVSAAGIAEVQKRFNAPSNARGKNLMVIIGSFVIATGLTFKDVLHEYVVPHWNDTETRQVIGRGIRTGSHAELAATEPDRRFTVSVYRMASLPNVPSGENYSIDVYMYRVSDQKRRVIEQVINLAKEYAITCRAFSGRNDMNPVPGAWNNDKLTCAAPDRPINHENAVALEMWDENRMKELAEFISRRRVCPFNSLAEEMNKEGLTFNPDIDTAYFLYMIRTGMVLNPQAPATEPRVVLHDEDGILYTGTGVDLYRDSFMVKYMYRNTHGWQGSEQAVYESYLVEFADAFISHRIETGDAPEPWEYPPETVQTLIQDCVSAQLLPIDQAPVDMNWDRVKAICNKYVDFFATSTAIKQVQEELGYSAAPNDPNRVIAAVWYASSVSGVQTPPMVILYKDFMDSEKSTFRTWKPADKDTINIIDYIKAQRRQDLAARAEDAGLKFTGRINPVAGDFCLASVEDDVSESDKRRAKVGKVCENNSKEDLEETLATLHGRVNDTEYRQELKSRTRGDMCAEIHKEFGKRRLSALDTSCGTQSKRRR